MGLRTFSGGTHGDAKGWRVSTTASYPLPSGPASSPHQMPAKSKGQRFIFWNDHSSKEGCKGTLVLQALLTAACWRLVCLIPALPGGLSAGTSLRDQTEKDKSPRRLECFRTRLLPPIMKEDACAPHPSPYVPARSLMGFF